MRVRCAARNLAVENELHIPVPLNSWKMISSMLCSFRSTPTDDRKRARFLFIARGAKSGEVSMRACRDRRTPCVRRRSSRC